MKINAGEYVVGKSFDIIGVSYAGNPRRNTAMYITKKVEYLVDNLKEIDKCLVFAEDSINIPEVVSEKNAVVLTSSPLLEYVNFAKILDAQRKQTERGIKYIKRDGYLISETAKLGNNVYIEPGCIIGHYVSIGNNVNIMAKAVIKNAKIGDFVLINEGAVIGANGFTIAKDENHNQVRIPTLGKVIIDDYAEIGVNSNISSGSAGDTIIGKHSKIDALVHIAHDVILDENVFIVAGSIIGGYTRIGKNGYTGINSSVKNRIKIGEGVTVGMATAVLHDVPPGETVIGTPARKI